MFNPSTFDAPWHNGPSKILHMSSCTCTGNETKQIDDYIASGAKLFGSNYSICIFLIVLIVWTLLRACKIGGREVRLTTCNCEFILDIWLAKDYLFIYLFICRLSLFLQDTIERAQKFLVVV